MKSLLCLTIFSKLKKEKEILLSFDYNITLKKFLFLKLYLLLQPVKLSVYLLPNHHTNVLLVAPAAMIYCAPAMASVYKSFKGNVWWVPTIVNILINPLSSLKIGNVNSIVPQNVHKRIWNSTEDTPGNKCKNFKIKIQHDKVLCKFNLIRQSLYDMFSTKTKK